MPCTRTPNSPLRSNFSVCDGWRYDKVQISPMHDNRSDNIFDDDNALDFILYEEFEKQGREQKGDKGSCLGIVVLLLLPVTNVMLLLN